MDRRRLLTYFHPEESSVKEYGFNDRELVLAYLLVWIRTQRAVIVNAQGDRLNEVLSIVEAATTRYVEGNLSVDDLPVRDMNVVPVKSYNWEDTGGTFGGVSACARLMTAKWPRCLGEIPSTLEYNPTGLGAVKDVAIVGSFSSGLLVGGICAALARQKGINISLDTIVYPESGWRGATYVTDKRGGDFSELAVIVEDNVGTGTRDARGEFRGSIGYAYDVFREKYPLARWINE